jgi:hypothetical protein
MSAGWWVVEDGSGRRINRLSLRRGSVNSFKLLTGIKEVKKREV